MFHCLQNVKETKKRAVIFNQNKYNLEYNELISYSVCYIRDKIYPFWSDMIPNLDYIPVCNENCWSELIVLEISKLG